MRILTKSKRLACGLDLTYSIKFPLGIHSDMMRKYRGFFDTETPNRGKMFGWDNRFQIRTSRQNCLVEGKRLSCVQPGSVTNLENLIELVPRPSPQVLDGHGTSSMFSFAYVCKAPPPAKLTDMNVLWLNDVRGGQHPTCFANLVK